MIIALLIEIAWLCFYLFAASLVIGFVLGFICTVAEALVDGVKEIISAFRWLRSKIRPPKLPQHG